MASALTLFKRLWPTARNGNGKAFNFPMTRSEWVFFTPSGDSIPIPTGRGSGQAEALGSSVVSAALQWIMRTFPEAPPVVERRQKGLWQEVPEHPLAQLLRHPNPFYGGRVLWMATVMDFAFGEAFWYKRRNNAGDVVELWWVPRALMEPKWPDGGNVFVSHYDYKVNGRTLPVPPEDVVHFRFGMDPGNMRRGFSQLAAVVREVYVDQEAANFTAAILKNLGIVGTLIAPADGAQPMGAQDVKDVKAYVTEHFTQGRRGEPLVFNRPTRFEAVQYNLQGFDVGPIRDIAEERVCAALGIPAAVIGFGTGLQQTKVGATMREMIQLAWRGAIMPTQAIIGDELDRSLLPDFQDNTDLFRVQFDATTVRALWEDETQKADRVVRAVTGGVAMLSEGRQALGYPVEEEHKIFYRPANVVPVADPGEVPEPPAPTPPPPPPEGTPPEGTPPEAKGHWVTIDDNPVFIEDGAGGEGGSASSSGASTPGVEGKPPYETPARAPTARMAGAGPAKGSAEDDHIIVEVVPHTAPTPEELKLGRSIYRAHVDEVAKRAEFPPENVVVHSSTDAPGTFLGGTEAGHYVPVSHYQVLEELGSPASARTREIQGEPGTVHLYPLDTELGDLARGEVQGPREPPTEVEQFIPRTEAKFRGGPLHGVVVHEIQHAKFDRVMTEYDREYEAIKADDNRVWEETAGQPLAYNERQKMLLTDASGNLRPQHAARFPTYAAIHPIYEGHSEWNDQTGKSVAVDGAEALEREDGISEYSRDWWAAYTQHRIHPRQGARVPINETLSEMALLNATKRRALHPSPTYRRLYTAVNREYQRLVKADRAKRRKA